MTKTRFTQWVVLACIGTLAACTSGEGGPTGNTELNVIIPNGSDNGSSQPGVIDVTSVEYTIVCQGGEQGGGFLEGNDGFTDAVTLNGNLEVQDGSSPPIAQGFMDIPPGDCLVQLRARDSDGEVICSGDNTLASAPDQNVGANEMQVVNIVLVCGNISFQAPVGMLDIRGDFSYFVGNFCPDLFVLNCLDTDLFPTPQGCDTDPSVDCTDAGPEVAGQTSCEVRFRDNDGGCNEGCDPQFCQEDANGLLSCTPASPPEDQEGNSMAGINVKTIVRCVSPAGPMNMDCDNNGNFNANACSYDGDQLGSLPTNINSENVPNPADFGVNCANAQPGETIVCTAVTTDGDRDCDKTKVIPVNCPGLTPCATYGGDAECQATATSQICLASVCDDALTGGDGTCDGRECCVDTAINDTLDCSSENPPLASCAGGVCTTSACSNDLDCDDGNDCTTASTCDVGTGVCSATSNEPQNSACTATGIANGVCDLGTCVPFECNVTGDCTTVECQTATCTVTDSVGSCGYANDDTATCSSCTDLGDGCACSGGSCNAVVRPAVATCDPTGGEAVTECIKAEFLAIDCALLGNSAALPIDARAIPTDVAFAGRPMGVTVVEAVVLPAPLVCGFQVATFQSAEVRNSFADVLLTNADVTSVTVDSFLDDSCGGNACEVATQATDCTSGVCTANTCDPVTGATCPPDPATSVAVSPHFSTFFSFAAACGCPNPTPGDLIPPCGTGPGIIASFVQGAPGSIPPGTLPASIIPTAPGAVDFVILEENIQFNLANLEAAFTIPEVCVGGACAGNACAPEDHGGQASPRIMYDSSCNKLQAAAGDCEPYSDYAGVTDVCVGRVPNTAPTECTDQATCCALLPVKYPTATAAQQPQLPVNPCFDSTDCTYSAPVAGPVPCPGGDGDCTADEVCGPLGLCEADVTGTCTGAPAGTCEYP